MKFILASDHGGYELKNEIKKYLISKDFIVEDLGSNGEIASYAYYGKKLGEQVIEENGTIGIGVCGTGLGISFAVNRIKGIRGARITSNEDALFAKIHNNANVLLFGGRQENIKEVIDMIEVFLNQKFEGGRHIKRIEELDQ